MPTEFMYRVGLPRTLRRQFILVLSTLALLILAGGLTAIYALRQSMEITQQLAGVRLLRMQEAQDLVVRTLLIERQVSQMVNADTPTTVRERYAGITQQLELIDSVVQHLAGGSDDVAVLSLHQSAQLLRNAAGVVAGLRESMLAANDPVGPARAQELQLQQVNLSIFWEELQRDATAMTAAAQALSSPLTQSYQAEVTQLADQSLRNQRLLLVLLLCGLVLAWLVSRLFLGHQVLGRLQKVSHYLRRGDGGSALPRVPVDGSDEIAQMARAVELFMADRQQLATANLALEAERTRQAELIQKLEQTQIQLLQSEKMAAIGQLAAGVAHEINNPIGFVKSNLGSLRGYMDDLIKVLAAYEAKEGEMTVESRKIVAKLKQEVDVNFLREDATVLLSESLDGMQRVKRIVQDLRNFSHVDDSTRQWVNLEEALDSTLNVLSTEVKNKAEVVKQYTGIPDIECFPTELNQVFMNLILNAAQSIQDWGMLTLRTGQEDENVWIEIQDTGTGIKPEHLGCIFDPFFSTKPVGKGSGLGLAVSYGIVQRHSGQISVRSEVGVGSVFRVTLPIRSHIGDLSGRK